MLSRSAVCRVAAGLAALWMALPAVAGGQMATLRNLALPPPPAAGGLALLDHVDGAAEIARGFGSADGQQAWNLKLAAVARVAGWRGVGLQAMVGHEMAASPYNEVGFSPRGAIWEEGLALTGTAGSLTWQLGGFHRCRHEIDNDRPSHVSVPLEGYEPTRRVTVLTGLGAAAATPPLRLGERLAVRGTLRLEHYAYRFDGRRPLNEHPPHWSAAVAGSQAGATLEYTLGGGAVAYARGWAAAVHFDDGAASGARWNHRVEAGLRGSGAGGALQVFAAREHFFDDLARPVPTRSTVLAVGVRAAGRGLH